MLLLRLLSPLLLRLLLWLRLLLSPLLLRLLLLRLLLLRLRPLLLRLRPWRLRRGALLLLCCRPRTFLWPALLLFRLGLFFALRFVLRVGRDNRPQKQNQGSGICSSKELHSNRLHLERS
jgi:hypothetical protein